MAKSLAEVSYFRNFIFGVEDSLVSTVGLLAGVAIGGMPRETIFLTGVVLIFVEAISMAAGSFLSESSAEEYASQQERNTQRSRFAALIMFVSYFVSGFIPLAPYLLFATSEAFWISIGASLVSLFVLGAISAHLSKIHIIKNALRMAFIGGLAIAVGTLVGHMFVV